MPERKFFVGERVILEGKADPAPEAVPHTITGVISAVWGKMNYSYEIQDKKTTYQLRGRRGKLYTLGRNHEFIGVNYKLRRLNPEELEERFEEILAEELGLVKRLLAEHPDETQRAATLTTVRNLARYLSPKIDAAYKEAEQLAKESDETGRAATLTTLRNLNAYLTERSKKQTP